MAGISVVFNRVQYYIYMTYEMKLGSPTNFCSTRFSLVNPLNLPSLSVSVRMLYAGAKNDNQKGSKHIIYSVVQATCIDFDLTSPGHFFIIVLTIVMKIRCIIHGAVIIKVNL